MFNVFRKTENFVCFQEALHEIAYLARETPEELLSLKGTGDSQKELRHPELDKPYFFELHARHAYWKDDISMSSIFDAAFPEHDQASTIAFFDSLIKSSPDMPIVFQECRTPFRIGAMKAALGGAHIYLSRHPLEQWWSQKTTPYFEIANRLFIDSPKAPKSVELLRNRIGFQTANQTDFIAKYQFHTSHHLKYEHQFELFLLLWSLAEIQAYNHVDIRVDMDAISENSDAKIIFVSRLKEIGVQDIDLSDCHIPRGVHSNDEIKMLNDKSVIILDMLKASGRSFAEISVVENAIKKAIEKSRLYQAEGDMSHIAKLKEINKSQHQNSFQLLEDAHGALQAIKFSAASKAKEIESLQSKLQLSDSSAVSLQAKLEFSDSNAASLQSKLQLSDTNLKNLQSAMNATVEKLNLAEKSSHLKDKKIETLSIENLNLSQEKVAFENSLKKSKADLTKQRKISTKLRKEGRQFEDRNADLISQFEQLNSEHIGFISASRDIQDRLAQTSSELAKNLTLKEENLETALIAIDEQKRQVKALEEMVAHQRAVISNREEQIGEFNASTSWKITAPLRAVRKGLSFNQTMMSRDELKSRGLVHIRKNPILKRVVLLFLVPFPRFKGRLENYAKANEALSPMVEKNDSAPDYENEEDWHLIPTLPNVQKWRAHFKGSL